MARDLVLHHEVRSRQLFSPLLVVLFLLFSCIAIFSSVRLRFYRFIMSFVTGKSCQGRPIWITLLVEFNGILFL